VIPPGRGSVADAMLKFQQQAGMALDRELQKSDKAPR